MTRRILSPSRADGPKLRNPLQPGEVKVVDFFDRHLAPGRRIYVQPFLNGLRPDIVLLNPEVGVGVFEVKDWALDTGAYQRVPRGIEVRDQRGNTGLVRDPRAQVELYRREVTQLYCPRLAVRGGIAAVTAGLVFPNVTTATARELVGRNDERLNTWFPVAGADALASGDLATVFPEGLRETSKYMSEDAAEDLRAWLVEPKITKERRRPIKLDAKQRELAGTRTPSGYRRIRGPAGSGKTLVLAERAARLSNLGDDVLVVSFNHTLRNYIADMVVQAGGRRTAITWLGFHAWCQRMLSALDPDVLSNGAWGTQWWLDQGLSKAVEQAFAGAGAEEQALIATYDAILVDEGQDFLPEWWSLLRRVLRPGGEMVLVADVGQEIYRRRSSWTESRMSGSGLTGRWAELEGSYRLPPALGELLRDFLCRFGVTDALPPTPAPAQQAFATSEFRWRQVGPDAIVRAMLSAVDAALIATERFGAGASDVCVLVDEKGLGESLRDELASRGYRLTHIFGDDERASRALKLRFFQETGHIKLTTAHSFKGWEAPLLVVGISHANHELTYASLSRLGGQLDGRSLQVVCSEPKYRDWGSTWPEFLDDATTGARPAAPSPTAPPPAAPQCPPDDGAAAGTR